MVLLGVILIFVKFPRQFSGIFVFFLRSLGLDRKY